MPVAVKSNSDVLTIFVADSPLQQAVPKIGQRMLIEGLRYSIVEIGYDISRLGHVLALRQWEPDPERAENLLDQKTRALDL